jgi:hypothetical protein
MSNRSFAAWLPFNYEDHMRRVRAGDVIFMYANGIGVTGSTFVRDNLGDEETVFRDGSRPPLAGNSLTTRDNRIAKYSANQVPNDSRLNVCSGFCH